MALGGPTLWTFEGGFGSGGSPGWGIVGGIWNVIIGAPNPFRRTGEIAEFPSAEEYSVISEIPEGWETVVIAGEERLVVPDVYRGPEPVLEPFDPGAVIGEVQGADTAAQEDQVVAHDWGHLAREFLGAAGSQYLTGMSGRASAVATTMPTNGAAVVAAALETDGGAAACDGMVWSGGTPPKGYKVVNYCGQGVLRKIRRRRRRRILSASDAQDIATIVGLVGKGQMASALINRRT